MTVAHLRPAWAAVDLAVVAANVRAMAARVAPAAVCAVVKADGYGHGAVPVARAALAGGAGNLAVALVEEGIELRQAGIQAPVLVLSEPPIDAWPAVIEWDLTPSIYTLAGVRALTARLNKTPPWERPPFPVHLKIDTGMHRVGADAQEVLQVARAVAGERQLRFEGLWTHFAVADEAGPFTDLQLSRLSAVRSALSAEGFEPELVHAANSAGALFHPAARLDFVRCGIAIYGYAPGGAGSPPTSGGDDGVDLNPALSLRGRVSHVRRLDGGETISYGRAYRLATDSVVATLPLGYADGVPRGLSAAGGQVLIRGRRLPMAGTVTMDQLMIDCGQDSGVAPGDEVVLLGRQGQEEITAEDWASRMGTISYEILCGVGPRVRREYLNEAVGS